MKADKYEVKEAEYTNETYDAQKELELKDELQNENKKYNNLKDEYNKFDKAQGIAVSKLEDLKAKLKAKFNKDEPKAKNLLLDKDFKLAIEKLKLEINESNSEKAKINKIKTKIEFNLTGLNEFNHLNIINKVDINIEWIILLLKQVRHIF